MKANLERAFYLAPTQSMGALISEAPPPELKKEAEPPDMHFQPEAGNEMKKGLWLKLTRMTAVRPYRLLMCH